MKSATDTLTDLVCEYVKWKDGIVHSGVLACAKWFLENTLDSLVKFVHEHDKSNLVLSGHSLGGAVVSVLTMMLVDHLDKFKTKDGRQVVLHTYSFAPPPIVSLNLARKYGEFIDSFVVEHDIIGRLSYGHMMDLRAMLVAAVESSKKPSLLNSLWTNGSAYCCCFCCGVSSHGGCCGCLMHVFFF